MKTRKPYSEEFKQQAVTFVIEQGIGVAQVARDLDVGLDTLQRWLRAARSPTNRTLPPGDPHVEVARLRREHEQLRMERDIVQKALGIFSRMPQ